MHRILRNEKAADWKTIKKTMADPNFIQLLTNLDVRAIPQEAIEDVEKVLKQEDLSADSVKKVSSAAGVLALWMHNIVAYYRLIPEHELPERKKKKSPSKKHDEEGKNIEGSQDGPQSAE